MSNTVLVAIATAAATTIFIDYALKPRLEARKTKILALHSHREDFSTCVLTIMGTCGRLTGLSLETTEPGYKLLRPEHQRWRAKLDESTEWLIDNVELYAGTYIGLGGYRHELIRFALAARGVWLSGRSEEKKIALLMELSEPVQGLFFAYWWQRIPHLLSNRRQLIATLDRIMGTDASAPSAEGESPGTATSANTPPGTSATSTA